MLDKCSSEFKCSPENVFLGHCAISPLCKGAADAIRKFAKGMASGGVAALPKYFDVVPRFHASAARLMKTRAEDISFVQNTATALSMIANGYPFEPGDQVISYAHEYPSNHYPWAMQQARGVELILLPDSAKKIQDAPRGWSMKELEKRVTPKTRVVAVSHVQFASGFAANLEELGQFCQDENIDLIVDCAQSLGCLPVYPEEHNIKAIASSGWKWLMGPFGAGLMYTCEEFRDRLRPTMGGPGMMKQGLDYLNLTWDPYTDGRMFEFSAAPWDHIAALEANISQLFLKNSMEDIRDEVFRLQDVFLSHLESDNISYKMPKLANRSGILPLKVKGDPQDVMAKLLEQGVVMTGPTGVLRLAPHFYMEDEQLIRAAVVLSEVTSGI